VRGKILWLMLMVLATPCLGSVRALAQESGQETPQDAAQQTPLFRSDVDLVQLQVGVANSRGDFVSRLLAKDFVIFVDGDPRPASVAYEVDLRGVTAASRPPEAYEQALASRPLAARRHFLLFFDFRFTTRRGVLEARRAALEFVDTKLRRSDVLAVANGNRFGVEVSVPFTTDVALAREAIEAISLSDVTDIDNHFNSRSEMDAEVATYVDSLEWVAELLRAAGGRKHLVLFSSGFPDLALIDALQGMEATVGALVEADVVVHAVDTRALGQSQNGRQSLNLLATGTGGEAYWNINNLDVVLDQIDDATNRYYMIAYAKKATDPAAVSIEVRVARPGVSITSAPTRLAPPPAEDEMTDDQKWLRSGEIQ